MALYGSLMWTFRKTGKTYVGFEVFELVGFLEENGEDYKHEESLRKRPCWTILSRGKPTGADRF